MSPLTHPLPAGWLAAYYDGELEAGQQAQLEAHLPQCAECRRELEALTALSRALAAAQLPPAAVTDRAAFWRRVQSQLPEQRAARPAPAPVSARRVLLRWSPGLVLLLLWGIVQLAAVAVTALMLVPAGLWPVWTTWLSGLAAGFTLGWLAWLLPASWSGWELLGFWLVVSAELAVLYLAWLGYELRHGPFGTFGPATT